MLFLLRLVVVLGAFAAATSAVLALFGFIIPELDLLNHGQILLFPGTIVGLVVVAALLRGQLRGIGLMLSVAGVLASGSIMLPEIIGSLRQRPEAPGTGSVSMMTHNLFGLNYDVEQVTEAIFAADPDIIAFQEYFEEQASQVHPALLAKYPFFIRCRGGKRANLGLYSRLPFVQVDDGACPHDAYGSQRTGHILARFEAPNGKSFSVITTHLDWPFPIARQAEQLTALSGVVDKIEGPVILAGDFNSTSWSYALRGFVQNNGMVRETMNLLTFPMSWFYLGRWRDTMPFLPLDHVMTRGGIVVHAINTSAPTGSDHLPVLVRFSVD